MADNQAPSIASHKSTTSLVADESLTPSNVFALQNRRVKEAH